MTTVDPALPFEVEPVPLDLVSVLPPRARGKDRLRLAASVLIGLLLHVLILWLLERRPVDVSPPVEEVIPVEVIVEPPKEEPPPPQQPEPQPQEEEPPQTTATDAPRSSDEDRAGNQTTPAPAREAPQPKSLEQPAKEPPKPADPWGLQTQLPNFEFEAPAPKTNLPKGNAEKNYLSTVYGMITQGMRLPGGDVRIFQSAQVRFVVDSTGRIFQSAVVTQSGSRELDAALLEAVRNASPLPPPPNGGPLNLTFTFPR